MNDTRRRFGSMAVEMGYITKDQFVDAMGMQLEIDMEGTSAKLFGEILIEMGYLDRNQVSEVLIAMVKRKK